MVRLLLKSEVDQARTHFPQSREEKWASKLVQQSSIRFGEEHTPLQLAAMWGDTKIVKMLLKARARSSTSSAGASPLVMALVRCDEERLDILDVLVIEGPTATARVRYEDFISYPGRFSTVRAAKVLLGRFPELAHMRRPDGETALTLARCRPPFIMKKPARQQDHQNVINLLEEYQQK